MRELVLWIPLLPLLGFVINIIWGKQLPKIISGGIGKLSVLASFILVCLIWSTVSGNQGPVTYAYFNWIETSSFTIPFSFQLDHLTLVMLGIITGVGFLIHLYSDGYMHEDEGYHLFFAYLNLFIFFMLLLVMGSNLLITFIGWEGVGLCSYLLIGFWFKDHANNDAAKKAFVMNRIGDLGFLIAMFLCLYNYKTLDYSALNSLAATIPAGTAVVTLITMSLFFGATGKSAQIPLYTWLPDAMAGPTPVSALIHAATMVTAGIYLITRLNGLFIAAPITMNVIFCIGIATAFFAAIMATRQNDIKKVLAYSTVSQLGYMFAALGAGAFASGMFHLTTHAFFKALLFLCAGSVIHAMSGEQDIRKMGGLKGSLKITHLTFLIGTLAIAGVPPFSGFFSKDEILSVTYSKSLWMFILLSITSVLTAVYMFRLYFLTFYGQFRGTEDQKHHLHESPWTMTVPLVILAILAAIGGFLGVPEVFHLTHVFKEFLSSIILTKAELPGVTPIFEYSLMGISIVLLAVIIILVYNYYIKKNNQPESDESSLNRFQKAVYNKFYIDELYNAIIVKPLNQLSKWVYKVLDRKITDGIVNQIGLTTLLSGQSMRKLQTGGTGFYIFAMVIGIIAMLCINFLFK